MDRRGQHFPAASPKSWKTQNYTGVDMWANAGVYYPVDFEPYTPADHFEKGEKDADFRTKLKLALELVNRAVQAAIPSRAIVADNFSGEDRS